MRNFFVEQRLWPKQRRLHVYATPGNDLRDVVKRSAATSSPVRPGISMSVSRMCGRCRSTAASASSPVPAVAITVMSGCRSSSAANAPRNNRRAGTVAIADDQPRRADATRNTPSCSTMTCGKCLRSAKPSWQPTTSTRCGYAPRSSRTGAGCSTRLMSFWLRRRQDRPFGETICTFAGTTE